MLIRAYGKINLTLEVLGKREDGYHNLKSVMVSTSLFDTLKITKNSNYIEESSHYFPDSILKKTYDKMKQYYPQIQGVKIVLKKRIPICAGMGGGSADAAALIKGINRIYHLGMSLQEMISVAIEIGSDVPFCLVNRPSVIWGKGDIIEPFTGEIPKKVLLIKPEFGISTKDVFQAYQGEKNGPNHLESAIYRVSPLCKEKKEEIEQDLQHPLCITGSGPTLFLALLPSEYRYFLKHKLSFEGCKCFLVKTRQKTKNV